MPVSDGVGLTLDRILVALDFAETSKPAFDFGKALAKRFSSRVTLTHVIDLSIATRSEQAVVGIPLEQMQRSAAENMELALDQLSGAGVRATGETLEAHNPAAAIIGLALEIKADIIVMGTHARHGLSRAIHGSCAEGVIRHATCPVLTVGPQAKHLGGRPFSFSNIVFATDLGHDAAEKAAVALTIGNDSSARLHLCHALEKPGHDFSRTLEEQVEAEAALRKLVPRWSYERCGSECAVEHGDAADHILKLAHTVNADLIVMGARRRTNWLATLSEGNVGQVLARAECPVMTVCTS